MTYVYTVEAYERQEVKIDVERFARDLCAAMGGTFAPEAEEYDRKSRGRFALGDVRISVWRNYTHKGEQVGLSIDAIGIPQECRQSFYGDKYKLPDITVSTSRPLATLVKDITKRLIDAAAEPIAARRAVAEQHKANQNSLTETVEAVRAAFPSLDVRVGSDGTTAGFSNRGGSPYVSGRIYAGGSISIDHCPSMTVETFGKVLRALKGESES